MVTMTRIVPQQAQTPQKHFAARVSALPHTRIAPERRVPNPAMSLTQRRIKRALDLSISAALLLLLAPLLAFIALLVWLASPGAVIYRQQRVGESGRLFTMYKFRSMVDGAPLSLDDKQPDDERVTRLGRFLRRSSLDELPQLVNVLRGDMSLVGPRPELPHLVEEYQPWQYQRLLVPQGITGWWQVNGRSKRPMHLHTDDDLYYIQHYSLWLDSWIMLKTVWVVLRCDGAY